MFKKIASVLTLGLFLLSVSVDAAYKPSIPGMDYYEPGGGAPVGAGDGEIPYVCTGIYCAETDFSYDAALNVLTVGGASIGGTGESIAGTNFSLDLDDGGAGTITEKATNGTNNEAWIKDFESTANTVTYSSNTGIVEEIHPWRMNANVLISGGGSSTLYDVSAVTSVFYKMEDNLGNTTVVDEQATYAGTSTRNTSVITTTGKIGNGFTFSSASSDKVDLGSFSPGKATGQFAFEVWMNHSMSTASSKRILGNRISGGDGTGVDLVHLSSTGRTQIILDTGSSTINIPGGTATNTGAWVHIVGQRDSSGNCALYVNGVLDSSLVACAGTLATAGNFHLGGSPLNSNEYTGKLDNFRFFTRSLTQAEITYLYNSGTGTESLSLLNTPIKVIAADDTTPDVSTGKFFVTSANTGSTAITDLDNPVVGQEVCITGGSATNSSTIADSGNFNLSAAFTASVDDVLCVYVQADNDYVETSRVNN